MCPFREPRSVPSNAASNFLASKLDIRKIFFLRRRIPLFGFSSLNAAKVSHIRKPVGDVTFLIWSEQFFEISHFIYPGRGRPTLILSAIDRPQLMHFWERLFRWGDVQPLMTNIRFVGTSYACISFTLCGSKMRSLQARRDNKELGGDLSPGAASLIRSAHRLLLLSFFCPLVEILSLRHIFQPQHLDTASRASHGCQA